MTRGINQIGKMIVFEGVDDVGKTTLSTALAEELNSKGIPCHWFSFPGQAAGTLGKLVYEIHHGCAPSRIDRIEPESLQLLHIAAHVDSIQSKIIPILKCGENVILDRFWWSTWAYGTASNVNPGALSAMIRVEKLSWKNIVPSALILLHRTRPNMLVSASIDRKLLRAYRELALREGAKYAIANMKVDPDVTKSMTRVHAYLKRLGMPFSQKK